MKAEKDRHDALILNNDDDINNYFNSLTLMYKIEILPQADKDICTYQKAGNKAAIKKIHEILQELSQDYGLVMKSHKSNPYLHIRKHLPDNYLLVEFIKT